MATKISVDLHPVFRSDRDIDAAVRNALFRAKGQGVPLVEIIPGKGSGQLRDRVLAMLRQPHLKKLYRSAEPVPGNAGVIHVHVA